MKKNKLKNIVNPDIIIQTIEENFNDILSAVIAITKENFLLTFIIKFGKMSTSCFTFRGKKLI